MVVVMTTMTVTSLTTTVKMTVVLLEAVKAVGVEDLRRLAPRPEHKSLESPRLHSLDMLQQNILILGQHENLGATRHGDPFRKTGRIP